MTFDWQKDCAVQKQTPDSRLSSWQTNNLKSLDSHLFACVRRGRWWWPRYETFGSLRLYCESEFKGSKVGRFKLKSKLWKVFDHTKFMKQDDSGQPNAFSKYGQSKLKAFGCNQWQVPCSCSRGQRSIIIIVMSVCWKLKCARRICNINTGCLHTVDIPNGGFSNFTHIYIVLKAIKQ